MIFRTKSYVLCDTHKTREKCDVLADQKKLIQSGFENPDHLNIQDIFRIDPAYDQVVCSV